MNYHLNTKMCFSIPVYSIYLQVMSNLHTHTHVTISFRGVMYVGLREKVRINWEGMEGMWIIRLHWNHLNPIILDKYFTFILNILVTKYFNNLRKGIERTNKLTKEQETPQWIDLNYQLLSLFPAFFFGLLCTF